MQHITPKNRQQYEFVNLEDFIDKNNPVCFVDAFADKLEFAHPKCQSKNKLFMTPILAVNSWFFFSLSACKIVVRFVNLLTMLVN
jgi:hypothetical protein